MCWVAFLVRLHHSVMAENSASHFSAGLDSMTSSNLGCRESLNLRWTFATVPEVNITGYLRERNRGHWRRFPIRAAGETPEPMSIPEAGNLHADSEYTIRRRRPWRKILSWLGSSAVCATVPLGADGGVARTLQTLGRWVQFHIGREGNNKSKGDREIRAENDVRRSVD